MHDGASSSRTTTTAVAATRRWLKRITAVILSMGAIAGAIAAILSLLPSADSEDSARVIAIRVVSGIPLGEYRQRLSSVVPQGFARILTDPTEATETPTPEPTTETGSPPLTSTLDTPTPEPTTETGSPPLTSTLDTPTPTSSSESTSESNQDGANPATDDATRDAVREHVLQDPELTAGCEDPWIRCMRAAVERIATIAVGTSLDPHGKPVPPDVAAERAYNVVKNARATTQGEPLGAVVTADVELVGLRGTPVMLTWSMWQKSGRTRLYGDWLNNNLAFRLQPTTDRDTTTVDMWIPLPKYAGSYFVRVDLTAERSRIASGESQPFR